MSNIKIINASAGSGKTHKLTELACRSVRDRKSTINADNLFATTFTIKAADELTERLRQNLLSIGMNDAVNLLPEGFVGTVNSVCARLLTQYAIDAGLSPATDVIPEEDSERIFNKAVNKAIHYYVNELESVSKKLGRQGGGDKEHPQPDWKKDVEEIAKLARSNCLDSRAIRACADKSWESFCDLYKNKRNSNTYISDLTEAATPVISVLKKMPKLNKGTGELLETLVKIKDNPSVLEKLTWNEREKQSRYFPTEAEFKKFEKCLPNENHRDAIESVQKLLSRWMYDPHFLEDIKVMIYGVFNCAALAVEHYKEYKDQHSLIDFTDQEAGVLRLLESTDKTFFRNSLKERLRLLFVDEFQDTSPLQLAIFRELGNLCDTSYWIGDPKQSIYGFRGADPALMNTVSSNSGPGDTETLEFSYRSRINLVTLSNAVFEKVFPDMSPTLKIPDERKEKAKGGVVEAWFLDAANKANTAARLADAIKSLLNNPAGYPDKALNPGDIAVLCRKNTDCVEVAAALENEKIGIRASTAHGLLVKTPACRLVLAAMRYLADEKDTLSMIEVINFSHDYDAGKDWLFKLVDKEKDFFKELKEKAVFKNLDDQRKGVQCRTPLEVMECAIEASGVLEAAKIWPKTPLSLANLDKLRQTCVQYLELCKARHDSGSLTGYFSYLKENKIKEAEGTDEQTVKVLTYHDAKGLGFPVVILFSLDDDPEKKASAFSLSAKTEGKPDPQKPLKNRTLHFWPNPIGTLKSDKLRELAADSPEQEEAGKREVAESQRLLYVGFTRAKDALIFAARREKTKLNTAWLDVLKDGAGAPLIKLSAIQEHTLTIGETPIPITIKEFTEDTKVGPSKKSDKKKCRPIVTTELTHYPQSRISPSKIEGKPGELSKNESYDLGKRIPVTIKNEDMHLLGDAVHDFIAIEQGKRNSTEWQAVAQRLLTRYGVDGAIDPADMVQIHDRLTGFIKKQEPTAKKVYREYPIMVREINNQVIQGTIDMLLELDNGFVIIDHKMFPGADAEERARDYSPQLNAYRRAVEAATGKKVLKTLIHMPILGKIYGVH